MTEVETSTVLEASSLCDRAPVYSPASAVGTCNVEYPELRPPVNGPVVLMNRDDLYVIVVALVVSDTECICVLTYHYTDGSVPNRNAEETRQCTAASYGDAMTANGLRGMEQPAAAAGGITKGDARHSERHLQLPGPCRRVRGVFAVFNRGCSLAGLAPRNLRRRGYRAAGAEPAGGADEPRGPVRHRRRAGRLPAGMRLRAYVLLRQLQQAEA